MKLLDLFITSSIPVIKILLITAVGLYMALDRVNILGQDARKHLNNVVFYAFSPSLIGSSLAETITYETLAKMWFMPVNVLLTFIIGSFLGWIVILITKAPSHLRGLIVGACAAGNLGNLPLIIIPAICKEKGSPFGDPASCERYGLGYVSLSMAIGAVYIWTYVYNLMRMLATRAKETEIGTSIESNHESCTVPLISSKEEDGNKVETWQRLRSLAERINLGEIFVPSTIAAIIALVIGLIPPIRKLLIGSNAPLHVIEDSVSLVGDGAIPALTLIIGGNLLRGLRSSGLQKSIIISVIVARYIVLPIVGVLIVRGVHRLGLVGSDPLYQFVLLLQFAVPRSGIRHAHALADFLHVDSCLKACAFSSHHFLTRTTLCFQSIFVVANGVIMAKTRNFKHLSFDPSYRTEVFYGVLEREICLRQAMLSVGNRGLGSLLRARICRGDRQSKDAPSPSWPRSVSRVRTAAFVIRDRSRLRRGWEQPRRD